MVVTESVGRMHIENDILQDESTEGIFILNADGNLVHLNKRAALFFGKKYDEIKDKPFMSIVPEKERTKIYSNYSHLFNGKGIRYSIQKYIYGRKAAFEININPIIQNNKTIMFVGTIKDITHIEEMKAEARRAFLREKIFRESVAHHFFNPLVIARGYVQLVIDDMPESDKKKRLEAAKIAIGRIEAVVSNVIKNGDIRE